MAKERKLGFVNCVSHPFSDSQGIPSSWQSSFISETLSSAFWKHTADHRSLLLAPTLLPFLPSTLLRLLY